MLSLITPLGMAAGTSSKTYENMNDLQNNNIQLSVVSQKLPMVLREIAQQAGFGANITGRINGTVRHRVIRGNLPQALDQLAAQHDFIWYADRDTVFVSPLADQVTAELPVSGDNVAVLRQRLVALGVDPEKWPLWRSADGEAMIVSAPRSYVDLVKSVLHAIHPQAPTAPRDLPAVYRGPAVSAGL